MIPEFVIYLILITQVGSDNFRVREYATKKLGDKPTDTMVQRFGARIAKEDPEVRRRLQTWLVNKIKVEKDSRFVGTWVWKPSWTDSTSMTISSNGEYIIGRNEPGTWKDSNDTPVRYLVLRNNRGDEAIWQITYMDKNSFKAHMAGLVDFTVEATRSK